ncbi:MAG: M13 family metallopeptidase [Deltaproteobacteria bacterium]|nr:M13 family metallopeptidase [Deltaproteobacteria bacterium]
MTSRSALALLAIAACSGKPSQPVPRPTLGNAGSGSAAAPTTGSGSAAVAEPPGGAVPSVKVTLAEVGLEASTLDRSSDPCVDFYQFACGGWLASNAVPPDRARWNRAAEAEERARVVVRGFLEEAAKGINVDAATRKAGDFYASCMDEAQLEKAGATALRPVLGRLEVKSAAAWLAAVAELHRAGVPVVWATRVEPDAKDAATNITQLDAGRIGLPDRDDYAKPEHKAKLDGYRQHVARLIALAQPALKPDRAEAAANDVVAIETELAAVTRTPLEKREAAAAYNPTDAAGLGKQVKTVDWKAYWKALGATPSKRINVVAPKYFAALDRVRAKFTWAQWSSYFTYHLAAHASFALPRAFDDEVFELRKLLTGVEKPQERAKRCADLATNVLGDVVGQAYVAKQFPAATRGKATDLVDALAKALAERLERAPWLGEASKKAAQQKLAKALRMVGYPERWRTHDFDVRRDDLLGNLLRAGAFETKRRLDRAGKPVDRGEWPVPALAPLGAYDAAANALAIPAGLLQLPVFGPDRSAPANLGGLALGVASELVHGFDDRGGKFDADGNLKEWWTADDRAKFEAQASCLAEQFDGFEALPKQFVSGKLTARENVADLAGVKVAFDAYRAQRKDAPKVYVADGFTEDQQFFLGVAQAQCTRDRAAEAQRRLAADPHSPPKFRVYGALRNLREFTEAFSCAPGTPMHPAKTCSVW